MDGLDSRAASISSGRCWSGCWPSRSRFLGGLPDRPVNARADVDDVAAALGGPLPEQGAEPLAVIDELVAGRRTGRRGDAVAPVLRLGDRRGAAGRPRGGLADLVVGPERRSAGLLTGGRRGRAGGRRLAARPARAAARGRRSGFVTGGMMANFTCLAAARDAVLRRVGWDVEADGLLGASAGTGAGRSGTARHHGPGVAVARTWGPAARSRSTVDDQGRMQADALAAALATGPADVPTIVCLQAGNVHSGAFDPFDETDRARPPARSLGARRRGLRAVGGGVADVPAARRAGVRGRRLVGHRRPQDPQRPVRLRAGHRRRRGLAARGHGRPRRVPDPGLAPRSDRHGAGVLPPRPRLHRVGGAAVARSVRRGGDGGGPGRPGQQFAGLLGAVDGVEIVNDVVFTQVCVSFGTDEVTREVARRLLRTARPG